MFAELAQDISGIYIELLERFAGGVYLLRETRREREREVFVGFLGQGAPVIDL